MGELGDLITGYPFESKHFTSSGIRLVRGANVKRGDTDFSKEISVFWKSSDGLEQFLLDENDIVIQMDGAQVGNSYARIKSADLPALLVQRVTRFRSDIITERYAYQCISSGSFLEMVQLKQTNTAVPHISLNDIKNFCIPWPVSLRERQKIADTLTYIDNLITLHQRKCDEISEFKKGMLQKMFPKDGETVPEIRFPGFKDDWVRYKLGDIYIERNERGNESLPILSVSIHSGVSDGELDEENLGKTVRRSEDKSTYKHVYSGDLVFNMMRAWQGAIGVVKNEGMVSPAYISAIPNDDIYPIFMDYLLRKDESIAQINNLSYGVTDFRKRLYWNSFVEVECLIPSIDEQMKIVNYLSTLDNYMTIHQRKVDALKEYKKGLLQQMFV